MPEKVFFVVEPTVSVELAGYAARHLAAYDVAFGTCLPACFRDYRLIVLWNLQRIIKDLPDERNVVVFHSSDLPKGRGWAPIYHALAEDRPEHVISAVLVTARVDGGDVVAKARFAIDPACSARELRAFDEEVCTMLAAAILERFAGRPISGAPQCGAPTYYKRRIPQDNEVDLARPLAELVPHLRACEPRHPAWFTWRGARYRISIAAESPPAFPSVRIEFGEDGTERPT